MTSGKGRVGTGWRLPAAWAALSASILAHGLAVAGMALFAGASAAPPAAPPIILTASLAPPGCGSGPAGPVPVPAEAPFEPQPPQEEPPVEAITARDPLPAPDSVVVPPKKSAPVKPKHKKKDVVKAEKPMPAPEPRAMAEASPALTDQRSAAPGGGSGASPGPALPSGGGAGPGSIGSPLHAGDLDNQPALVSAPKPEYPYRAKRLGLRAMLRVRLLVDTTGHVERVDILGGDHADQFAESVRSTLVRWRFKPGTRKGAPVYWVAILPISFEMD